MPFWACPQPAGGVEYVERKWETNIPATRHFEKIKGLLHFYDVVYNFVLLFNFV